MKKRIPPKPGQESVWDYPRPPKLEPTAKHIRIWVNDQIIADTNQSYRILETSHPPVYYLPPKDVRTEWLRESQRGSTYCEFKGKAVYWDLVMEGETRTAICWCYPDIRGAYQAITDYFAFYPSKVDACYVNDERVQSQKGDFYGGWITPDIVGPFKGGPGTFGW